MQDTNIIRLLDQTGHLRHPFGESQPVPTAGQPDYPTRLDDPRVMLAVESYQDFMALPLEPLMARHHPERRSAAVQVDGRVGPALRELFEQPRCACPDYGLAVTEAATGSGNWKGCHGIGSFHAAVVMIDEDNLPEFLKGLLVTVLRRVQQAYDEVGLRFVFIDGRRSNYLTGNTVDERVDINASWVRSSDGWIGLAIVGDGLTCSTAPIWCRYLGTYRGGTSEADITTQWTSLWKHELGHNCGLQHSRGGVMNPSIITGLPVSWQHDPSEPLLKQWYGGEPIPSAPVPPPTPGPIPPGGEQTWFTPFDEMRGQTRVRRWVLTRAPEA